jgi:hypothetical protein
VAPLARAFLGVAGLFVLIPVADLVLTAWPPRLGEFEWRYGFLGLLANLMMTPLMGALLASLAARSVGGRTLRGVSASYVVAIVLLAIGLAVFALDVRKVTPEMAATHVTDYRVGAVIAAAKYLLTMGGLAWLAIAGFRSAPPGSAHDGVAHGATVVGGG